METNLLSENLLQHYNDFQFRLAIVINDKDK